MKLSLNINSLTHSAELMGDSNGEKALLLHGFPVTYRMWQPLQLALAEMSIQSLAPELLGYGALCRPEGTGAYRLDNLVESVLKIADEMNLQSFHLVGHDWGSFLGWAVAALFPERIKSFTALSVPHPMALSDAIRNDKHQKEASLYMENFKKPQRPEIELAKNDYALLKSIWTHSSKEEVESYLSCFSQDGALTATLNWYRANYDSMKSGELLNKPITIPVHYIWGKRDGSITKAAAMNCFRYVEGDYKETFLDCGHWLVEEMYSELSILIQGFIEIHK